MRLAGSYYDKTLLDP
eukprot:gene10201-biopygen1864